MKIMTTIVTVILISVSLFSYSQTEDKRNTGWYGQIGVQTDFTETILLNLGGIQSGFQLNKNLKLGFQISPSLKVKFKNLEKSGFTVAAGPIIRYKKTQLNCFFHKEKTWKFAIGFSVYLK